VPGIGVSEGEDIPLRLAGRDKSHAGGVPLAAKTSPAR
jgi:hypothetical protein